MTNPQLYILAILILLFTPGPTNTLLCTSGAQVGIRRSLNLLSGELFGYLAAILTILLVLEPIMTWAPRIKLFLSVAMSVYIFYLALSLWVRSSNVAVNLGFVSYKKIFITTLLNPKSFIFAITIIPSGHPQMHWYLAALAICIVLVGMSWIIFGHILGLAIGKEKLLLFNRCSSVILTGFAGYIIASALY